MAARREDVDRANEVAPVTDRFSVKARLNLNDLLRRRTEERQVRKKTNLIIWSGATAVLAVVLLILNL